MNEYRNRNTGAVLTEPDLRTSFPNKALPQVLDYFTLEAIGFDAVLSAPPPPADYTQKAIRNGVTQDEKGNWIEAWRLETLPADVIAANAAAATEAVRNAAKDQRAASVAAITVTVDGMVFDGDEVSQGRMARAILAMESAGVPTTPWTLSNNTIAAVTSAQLRAALVKAGLAQTAVWALP